MTPSPPPSDKDSADAEKARRERLDMTWMDPMQGLRWLMCLDHKMMGRWTISPVRSRFSCACSSRSRWAACSGPISTTASERARHDDDVSVRHADAHGGPRPLFRAADDRRAQRRVSAAHDLRLLSIRARRHRLLGRVPPGGRPGRRLDELRDARRPAIFSRQGRRFLGRAHPDDRGGRHGDGDRHGHHHPALSRPRHVAQPHASLCMVDPLLGGDDALRHDGGRGRRRVADDGPHHGYARVQPGKGRRCSPVAAPVLVLCASRGLHHLSPRRRDHLHHPCDIHAALDLRLYGARALVSRHSLHRLRRLGACTTCSRPGSRSSA